jgi:lipopolysaccharide export system protein LptA
MSDWTRRLPVFSRAAVRMAVCVVLVLILAFPASAAEEQERVNTGELGRQPIEITSDRLSADSTGESVTFEGNVVAIQGDVTLHADKLFAEYTRSERAIEKITAEGNVRVIQGGREARAARATFYNMEQRIVLTGGAELMQGENTLKGGSVTIYLRENRSVVTGGKGGRVRAIIHPQRLLETKEKEDR